MNCGHAELFVSSLALVWVGPVSWQRSRALAGWFLITFPYWQTDALFKPTQQIFIAPWAPIATPKESVLKCTSRAACCHLRAEINCLFYFLPFLLFTYPPPPPSSDYGFKLSEDLSLQVCVPDPEFLGDLYAPPVPCPVGTTYRRSKG